MKKWSLILWFAVIVGAAFIFTACEGDDSDDGAGETFIDVKDHYFLASGAGKTEDGASGLEIASALKSSSTGDVTIVLTGKVKPDYWATAVASGDTSTVTLGSSLTADTWTNAWGDGTYVAGAEPGFYGAAYISGIITKPIAAGTLAIKQTNEALRLYKGRTNTDIVTEKPDTPPVPPAANIWIPAAGANDTPFKWKVYVDNATNKTPKLDSGAFGVLLWDGGASGTSSAPYSNKKAVLEVESASFDADGVADVDDGLFRRYIIDYSGVKFDLADLYPLVEKDGSVTGGATAAKGNADNLDTSAVKTFKEDGTPVITITLKNKADQTFTGTADFESSNNVWGAKPTGNTVTGVWSDIAVDLKLALGAVASGKTLSVKQTSQALNYYTGAGDLLNSAPIAPSTSGGNIWIDTSATPVKWKKYDNTVSPDWGIILWSGESSKKVTLEIFQHDDANNPGAGTLLNTVVIDYSGVTITTPASGG